ncbi:MAG: AsmA family protein [Verrucomicrobia bacterium]|nr:AsmA family protein [Verrucomicrobiota bacterium]
MRTFFKSILGIVVICILAGTVLFFLAKSRLPDMIASRLSKTLQVNVQIGDIDLSMNRIKIENLEISNPKGYKLQYAFTTQEIDIHAPLTGYLKQDIVIDEIDLNNVYLGLEFASPKGTTGNWTTIMTNAQNAQTQSTQTKSEKTVLIKRLVLNNINAELLYQSEGKIRRLPTIPQIVLVNISSKGGNLTDQLMNSALGEMVKEIFIKENLKDALDSIFQNIPGSNPVKGVLQPLKGLFNARDAEEEIYIALQI